MSDTSHFPRTNKELQKLARQWFFRCFRCDGLFHSNKVPHSTYFCADCKVLHVREQRSAAAAMASARRKGWNDRPENHACVDCGAQGEIWEHRSYLRPLDVVPTCHSCNVRRGPASHAHDPQVSANLLPCLSVSCGPDSYGDVGETL